MLFCQTLCCHLLPCDRWQSDKMASDKEVRMEQRCDTEFLHAEKMAPTDIHQCLLNIYGDQTADVSTEAVAGAFQ